LGRCRSVAPDSRMHEGITTMTDRDGRMTPCTLTRRQFDAFNEVGRAVRISDDERRRLLLMSAREWSAWEAFLADDGALPARPEIPVVLRRLASASYRLAVRADLNREHRPAARARAIGGSNGSAGVLVS
jgi:hypothetical protein